MFTMAKGFNGWSALQQIYTVAQLIISNQTNAKTFQINLGKGEQDVPKVSRAENRQTHQNVKWASQVSGREMVGALGREGNGR